MEKTVNLIPEFIEESKSQIEEVREQLEDFLALLRKGEYPEFNAFSTLIRAVHSISGGSSVAGLVELESASARLSKLISLVVSKSVESGALVADQIENAVALIENALNNNGKIKKKDIAKIEKDLDKIISSGITQKAADEKNQVVEKKEQKERQAEKAPNIEDTVEDKNNEYLSFRIGAEHYAVPITVVYDMKQMLPCSRIPNQPEHFLGVANLRGNVIPVIDLRKVFGIKDISYGEFTVFLMLKVNEKIKGCVVDSIDDVVFLEPENTHLAPMVSRKIRTDFVKFIANDPKTKRFLIVLDIEKMLEND
ncbi:MAG TPA: chemotaxis protein CheW [bacterium]|nr:chemotaxis protein CheW [bacterium]HPS29652.1 chemotaxis protein CheW [bacterium]